MSNISSIIFKIGDPEIRLLNVNSTYHGKLMMGYHELIYMIMQTVNALIVP